MKGLLFKILVWVTAQAATWQGLQLSGIQPVYPEANSYTDPSQLLSASVLMAVLLSIITGVALAVAVAINEEKQIDEKYKWLAPIPAGFGSALLTYVGVSIWLTSTLCTIFVAFIAILAIVIVAASCVLLILASISIYHERTFVKRKDVVRNC